MDTSQLKRISHKLSSIAKSLAGAQVVSNQIAVLPPGSESDSKTVNSDLDKAIEKNLDATLIKQKLHKGVKYDVRNGVVTLTGEVGRPNGVLAQVRGRRR